MSRADVTLVLRMTAEDAETFSEDARNHPDSPLLTPTQEHEVQFSVVAAPAVDVAPGLLAVIRDARAVGNDTDERIAAAAAHWLGQHLEARAEPRTADPSLIDGLVAQTYLAAADAVRACVSP